jgi:hypothetical protein
MALNIKKLEAPKAAYEVEDVSMANKVVEEASPGHQAELNLTQDESQTMSKRISQIHEQKERELWHKKLWMISRM